MTAHKLSKKEFARLALEHGVYGWTKGYKGCQLVMVEGLKPAEAAAKLGISVSTITRVLPKLQSSAPRCDCCGGMIR